MKSVINGTPVVDFPRTPLELERLEGECGLHCQLEVAQSKAAPTIRSILKSLGQQSIDIDEDKTGDEPSLLLDPFGKLWRDVGKAARQRGSGGAAPNFSAAEVAALRQKLRIQIGLPMRGLEVH